MDPSEINTQSPNTQLGTEVDFSKVPYNCVDLNKYCSTLNIEYCYSHEVVKVPGIAVVVYIKSLDEEAQERFYKLNEVLQKIESSVLLDGKAISLYDADVNYFIYCGLYPLKKDILVPLPEELSLNDKKRLNFDITIKVRTVPTQTWSIGMEIEENTETVDEHANYHDNPSAKRSKERKIGFIIEKVFLWRRLYKGFKDESGKDIQYTLEDAAKVVGISKKSLDDYLIQLRIGKSNGFDFNGHKNDKVGVLRDFVRKKREGESTRHNHSQLDVNE